MRKQIVHLSVHQTSKVIGILYFLMIFVFIVPASVILYLQSSDPTYFLLFFYPFLFAILTYISTAITAWFYNLVARSFGGIEFDLEDREAPTIAAK